jgi:hypothetical protein
VFGWGKAPPFMGGLHHEIVAGVIPDVCISVALEADYIQNHNSRRGYFSDVQVASH